MLLPQQHFLQKQNIILASSSQGRKQLLQQMGLFEFQIYKSNFEENLDKSLFSSPIEYARATCKGKVQDVLPRLEQDNIPWNVLIFADTICDFQGKIIEKPQNKEEIKQFLNIFNGKWHSVHTCVNVLACNRENNNKSEIFQKEFVVTTELLFAELTQEMIDRYCEEEELWRGKAGGYAIQGRGMPLIQEIKGCYSNIIGLPIFRLSQVLLQAIDFLRLKNNQ